MDNISEHVTYKEAIRSNNASRAGIDNIPSDKVLAVMRVTANKLFEPLRKWVGKPIYISSFFRTKVVNKLAGSKTDKSQHILGEAMDIDMDVFGGRTNYQAFCWLRDNVEFDQLFWEGGENGWIHISYREGKNRKMVGEIPKP